jgi:hypothetical protein
MSGKLPESLSSITFSGQESFEDALLRVYAALLNTIAAKATLGMSSTTITPEFSAIGENHNWYSQVTVAKAMVCLLRSEGLEAQLKHRCEIYVKWPNDPTTWWNSDN